ncbi:hypothetical protein VNO80_17855 [Phaseolus coccineus]|uniref:Uncharacterized protein n=1 Tax=Phaseolus coccineus TaxID=3886 RepID=A0AAN9MJ89_PHACN
MVLSALAHLPMSNQMLMGPRETRVDCVMFRVLLQSDNGFLTEGFHDQSKALGIDDGMLKSIWHWFIMEFEVRRRGINDWKGTVPHSRTEASPTQSSR